MRQPPRPLTLRPSQNGELIDGEGQRWMISSSHFQKRCSVCGKLINSGLCTTVHTRKGYAPPQFICTKHALIQWGYEPTQQ